MRIYLGKQSQEVSIKHLRQSLFFLSESPESPVHLSETASDIVEIELLKIYLEEKWSMKIIERIRIKIELTEVFSRRCSIKSRSWKFNKSHRTYARKTCARVCFSIKLQASRNGYPPMNFVKFL